MPVRETLNQAAIELHMRSTDRVRNLGRQLMELRDRGLPDEPYHPEREAVIEIDFQIARACSRVSDWFYTRLDSVLRAPSVLTIDLTPDDANEAVTPVQ